MYLTVNMPDSYRMPLIRIEDSPAEKQYQVDLVLNSIADIERAIKTWREIQSDPTSTIEQRTESAQAIAYRERDFGGHWSNVKSILSRIPK